MLHITNGDSVQLNDTGLPGTVVYWRDVLHEGPVPSGLSFNDLSRLRERFLSEYSHIPLAQCSFEWRNRQLAQFQTHEEVVLWFEHDLYDQLQLLQILDWFAEHELSTTKLSLICGEAYLGPMAPEQLLSLFDTRHPVSALELETAQKAWAAFRMPDPGGVLKLVNEDTSALPFLRTALLRYLEQFPSRHSGLSRTETQALHAIDGGARNFHDIFLTAQRMEPWIFLGDTSFQRYLDGLSKARHPLLVRNDGAYQLTNLARSVLSGREDWVRLNGINRWLGGVHLCEGAPVWRWDAERRTLTP